MCLAYYGFYKQVVKRGESGLAIKREREREKEYNSFHCLVYFYGRNTDNYTL
jgi:hypothetical protein